MEVRRHIDVAGIVQGVGFRPYVYRLAVERHLAGNISNTAAGVSIEVQGPSAAIEEFVAELSSHAPALARITDLKIRNLPCSGEHKFRILTSRSEEPAGALISPDVAVCADCRRELFDPGNRRFRYPFINCTNCGPRFTIVRKIPYDRPHTSMAVFPMCPECEAEYQDPLNRRFHAQPNACQVCGPHVELWDNSGEPFGEADPISEALAVLQAGQVLAIKGLGGFHLAVDATLATAVQRLRGRKGRVEKPFAIMVPNLEVAEQLCEVNAAAAQALQSVQRPIVLLPWKQPSPIADAVAPHNRCLGVFLPYTPLHYVLFAEGGFTALVMTSGNLSEEPIAIDNEEAVERLGGLADCFLVHNRDILLRCDDSVTRVIGGTLRQLRRSRGFVPVPVFLKQDLPRVLAVGAELKNSVCLIKGKHAFLSQHIGDLENAASYKFFEQAIEHLESILEIRPEIVAHDLHPDYFSTRWALRQQGAKLVGVQHHHAHIASCMAENHLDGRVIGLALDGTGFGTDGKIWGGEVLLCDYADFERAAHLQYVAMPGGAAAIREPWRMAVSYLWRHYGPEFMKLPIPFVRQVRAEKVNVLLCMMERNVNSPLTSSCGRLFDAVAALAGVRQKINYEAQAAIELEMLIAPTTRAYPFAIRAAVDGWIIDTRPCFDALIDDLSSGVPAGLISAAFHNGLVEIFLHVAKLLRERESLNRVCLSGGSFQNAYLSEQLHGKLVENGFEVFTHSEVPAGDGGLALGQALIAAHRLTLQTNSGIDIHR
ncbi:MAG: carbamoyltransferase HypF [Acidobacteria bacterium]|nr:MAG: carbamoyltransferase HypF [Acidobacteriota bacterium]